MGNNQILNSFIEYDNIRTGEVVININNINLKLGKGKKRRILQNVSFVIKKGEIHGFVGPNGAGKTTIIKSILDAYPIADGTITILGKNKTNSEWKKIFRLYSWISKV